MARAVAGWLRERSRRVYAQCWRDARERPRLVAGDRLESDRLQWVVVRAGVRRPVTVALTHVLGTVQQGAIDLVGPGQDRRRHARHVNRMRPSRTDRTALRRQALTINAQNVGKPAQSSNRIGAEVIVREEMLCRSVFVE